MNIEIPGQVGDQDDDFQIAPLIDIVFLLLIFFMLSATTLKTEADIGFQFPWRSNPTTMHDEQIVEIFADERVILNGQQFDVPGMRQMPELTAQLKEYRKISESTGNPSSLTLAVENAASHQRVVDVMNACAAAGIDGIAFGLEQPGFH